MLKGWSDCGNRRGKRKDVQEEDAQKRRDHRHFKITYFFCGLHEGVLQ